MNRFLPFVLCGFTAALAAQQPPAPAFDVASIRRNTDPKPARVGTMRDTRGEIRVVAVPVRSLVLFAYPLEGAPAEVAGAPSWADSERYDVTVKLAPDATADQVTQMWRTLLADRMKLAAHYEPRDVRGYRLVVARADGTLGPELKPSKLDCAERGPAQAAAPLSQELNDPIRPGSTITRDREQILMSRCRLTIRVGNTTYGGGVNMSGLVTALRVGGVRDPIEDHTGLDGLYAFKLTFLRQTLNPQTADTGDAPSIFTAVQEQLGLKLEPATIRSQAVVIDRIERPTEN